MLTLQVETPHQLTGQYVPVKSQLVFGEQKRTSRSVSLKVDEEVIAVDSNCADLCEKFLLVLEGP